MGKSVSTIIATILMLLITVALAGTAYLYISGVLTGKTGTSFSIIDSFGDSIVVKNDGMSPITEFTTFSVDDAPVTVLASSQDSSLVGYWKFDAANSTNGTADSSGNGNDGIAYKFNTNPAAPVAGRYDKALDFDGADSFVNVTDSMSLDMSDAYTISAWVYPGAYGTIVNKNGEAQDIGGNYIVSLDTDGKIWLWDRTLQDKKSVGTVPLNQWSSVIVAVGSEGSNKYAKFYINGQLDSTAFGGTGQFILTGFVVLPGTSPWWNTNYQYRQRLNLTNINASWDLEKGFTYNVTFNSTSNISAGRVLSSGNDMRVVIDDGNNRREISRQLNRWNDPLVESNIAFGLDRNISKNGFNDSYYLYYGYPSAAAPNVDYNQILRFFDDFNYTGRPNATKWWNDSSSCPGGCVQVNGSHLVITGDLSWTKGLINSTPLSRFNSVYFKGMFTSTDDDDYGVEIMGLSNHTAAHNPMQYGKGDIGLGMETRLYTYGEDKLASGVNASVTWNANTKYSHYCKLLEKGVECYWKTPSDSDWRITNFGSASLLSPVSIVQDAYQEISLYTDEISAVGWFVGANWELGGVETQGSPSTTTTSTTTTVPSEPQPPLTGINVKIGSAWWQRPYFDGLIDEVRIFNRTLGSEEAKAVFGMGGAINPASTATIKIYSTLPPGRHKIRLCTRSMCQSGQLTVT